MKAKFDRLNFRPRNLAQVMANESTYCKLRIAGCAIVMASVTVYFQEYFDGLVFRSSQFQISALAGERSFLDYKDNKYSNEAWQLRQKLDVLSEKPLKELKQINQGWKTQKYSNGGVDIYTDPNGNPYDNSGYYTQKTKFYSEWSDAFNSKWAANAKLNPIERDAKKYKEWETMHDSVLWFDTAACMAGPFIGDTISVTMAPDSNSAQLKTDPQRSYAKTTPASDYSASLDQPLGIDAWYTGATYSTASPMKDWDNKSSYNALVSPQDSSGPYQKNYQLATTSGPGGSTISVYKDVASPNGYRAGAWDVGLSVKGKIDWADKELTKALWQSQWDLLSDCDIDCQKRGSQLTVVGVLMGTVYGVIALNSLAMFLGVFFLGFRVCSIYCTFIACLFHAAVIVVTPIILLTKYNGVCSKSLFQTYDGFRWTMFDDFQTTWSLWIASFFVMFGFLFCGLQSAYSPQQSTTIGNKF